MNINSAEQFDEDLRHIDVNKLYSLAQKFERFLEDIQPGQRVVIFAHSDSDGLVSAAFMKNFLIERFKEKGVELGFSFFELQDERFEQKADNYDHVIVLDLWIDNEEERQKGLRNLLRKGKNVAVIDHHDRDFYEYNESNPPQSYNPLMPETVVFDEQQQMSGKFLYISPRRLGCDIDSSAMTTGILVKRLIQTLSPFSQVNFGILPLSIWGDSVQTKWPQMNAMVDGRSFQTYEMANTINLSESLIDVRRMVSALARSTAGYLDELQDNQLIRVLESVKKYTHERADEVLREKKIDGHAYHHVDELESQAVKNPENMGMLRTHPVLHRGLSTSISRRLQKKPAIVTQIGYVNRRPSSVLMSIKYDGHGEIDTRDIAANFLGGGHPKASGARIKIPHPDDKASIQKFLKRIEDTLRLVID